MNRKQWFFICFGMLTIGLYAYNPPAGGQLINQLQSPAVLSGTSSVAGNPLNVFVPGLTAFNPSLAAAEQRVVIDLSYTGIAGFASQSGYGNVFNAALVFPSSYGVLYGNVQGILLPRSLTNMPLGNLVVVRAGYAKDLVETLYIGGSIDASFGESWGVNAALGMWQQLGTVSFMKNVSWGVSVTGIGKPYTLPQGSIMDGYPSFFTPHIGASALLISTSAVKLGASVDVSFPVFQNAILDVGLAAQFFDMITLRSGWTLNVRETIQKQYALIPSVGLSVKIGVKTENTDSFLNKNGWGQSELVPSIAVRSLYTDIMAFSTGLTMYFGLKDTQAPVISIWED